MSTTLNRWTFCKRVRWCGSACLWHVWLLGVCCASLSTAADRTAPFVSGYDRFFDHEQSPAEAGGRLLLSELGCTACHSTSVPHLRPKPGPRLSGVGNRLQGDWVRRFLADPQAVKPGTTMPQLLAGLSERERDAAAAALASYLSTLRAATQPGPKSTGTAPVAPEFWSLGDPQRGRRLYHQAGCVACHEPDEDHPAQQSSAGTDQRLGLNLSRAELLELGVRSVNRPIRSVPHAELSHKYHRKSLTLFLLDPLEIRPGGRMPNLKLQLEEAADIAAYLIPSRTRENTPAVSSAEVARGRRLFEQLKCGNCHAAQSPAPRLQGPPLDQLRLDAEQHCLGPPRAGWPDYGLPIHQQEAIAAAIQRIQTAVRGGIQFGPAERLEQTLLQLNCYGCHERGQRGGIGPRRRPYFETVNGVDLGDEGRMPPPLDGVGRKFQPAWLKRVLHGQGDVRAYMQARMPAFGETNVEQLQHDLVVLDRPALPEQQAVFEQLEPAPDAAKTLLGAGCIQCHPIRGEALPGVAGIDLAQLDRRLSARWFRDFLLNPAALKRRTRMPTFFAGGKSPNQDVLQGDVLRQIAAIWFYLRDVQNQSLPERLEREKTYNFELRPSDQPLVLRTFMQHAGTHAIAVGFPQQVHYAFDAETVRLAAAWRGRFLDAHGTWFDRFTPLAKPLGSAVITFPRGAPLASLPDPHARWPQTAGPAAEYRFLGYRLDRQGVPTLLYRYGAWHVEERAQPSPDGKSLVRRLRVTRPPAARQGPTGLWFRAAQAQTIERDGVATCLIDSRIRVTVDQGSVRTEDQKDAAPRPVGRLRQFDLASEWIIPLAEASALEVQYQWSE